VTDAAQRFLGVIHRADGTTVEVTYALVVGVAGVSRRALDFRTTDGEPFVPVEGERIIVDLERSSDA